MLQEDNFIKTIEPREGSKHGQLYFGHTGQHYVALKKSNKDVSNNCLCAESRVTLAGGCTKRYKVLPFVHLL